LVQKGRLITRSWPAGLPIGVDSKIEAQDITIQLTPGDTVVAYTDGVADARPVGEQTLGFDGARAMLGRAALSADPVTAALDELGAAQRRDWQADDTTALFLRFVRIQLTSEIGRDDQWMPR
jgi:serine phosphatase RsbU (regulator of sigma subunit)